MWWIGGSFPSSCPARGIASGLPLLGFEETVFSVRQQRSSKEEDLRMIRTMRRHFYRRSNFFLVSTEGDRVRVHSYSADGATEVHESEGASPGSQSPRV